MITKTELYKKYFDEKNKAKAYKHEINRLTDNLANLGEAYLKRGKILASAKNEAYIASSVACVSLITTIILLIR